ncbi:Ankyrin repeat and protein kinase domain-containing protein [Lachnellula suecica]|uniref:Ankyrin repeat and protein kinase domain-containing protein n=1 Tax=Lachnellula suecica TaxID=602035 RepID=A0A8T9CDV3_9HELO|nr:Ankyrin repeat and protein kinase domain-containing protein [Lachnellula suecica]
MENVYPSETDAISTSPSQTRRERSETVESVAGTSGSISGVGRENNCLASDNSPNSSRPGEAGWLSPLHIAAQKGHNGIARVLLQHNTDCNERDSDGLTPLVHAAVGGYEEVVDLLLSRSARICTLDNQGRSVLHWAVVHRREDVLRILLNHCTTNTGERRMLDGYDNEGKTPLHMAIDTGFEAGVQILLDFGANVHFRARKSSTKIGLEEVVDGF